ncbi:MAG: hypothetical protein ACXWQO_03935 [Bdellovibrionota bacterium]
MNTSNTLRILAVLSIWFLLTGCDHGSKQAFADSIRAAGHFEKK